MNPIKIGNLISKKRKEKKYTQKELADKLGVTDRAISKWERGVGCPDISYLEDLSKLLDISVVELLRGEEKKEIDDSDLIDSIKLSSDITKYNIKKTIGVVTSTIIIFLTTLLIVLNINNLFLLNKKSKSLYQINLDNLDNYYKIIKNNQGIYDNDDSKLILNYINNKYKLDLNNINDKYEIRKYYKFFNEYSKINIFEKIGGNDIYKILVKYDSNIVQNMIDYYSMNIFIHNTIVNYYDYIEGTYSYFNKNINKPFVDIILNYTYTKEEMLLKDIIKVGELDV